MTPAPNRPRPPLWLTTLTAVLSLLFLAVGAYTGNYGAWATGAVFVLVAAILTFLRVRR